MKIPKTSIQSQLAHKVVSEKNDEEKYQEKKELWLKYGSFVLTADQLNTLSNMHKIIIEAIATVLYGKR
jgi:hypothetical protein